MRVIIIGAGEVGSNIADDLDDDHDVVLVDRDPETADQLSYSLDVLTVTGDGTTLSTLEEAGVGDADMLIASTDVDETNIVACATAKAVADPFTIARVKNVEFLHTWERSQEALGVDFMVCTNLLAARSIAGVAGLPAARDAERFADGTVRMAEFEVDPESAVADQTVREADRFDALTFAAVVRDGEMAIPRGDTLIRGGDRVVVIGSPDSVRAFAGACAPEDAGDVDTDVVVVGGSEIASHVAELLGERGFGIRLIEQDPDRARQLAEELPDTLVMQHDATDLDFLDRENVGDADLVVAALDSDERNLVVSLLARRLGAERTVAVIRTPAYVELFEAVGVDVGVNPREVVAREISRFTRGGAERIAIVESGEAEVLEIEVEPDSVLADRTIMDSTAELPDGVVIGALTRGGEFVTPRGDTVVRVGDHVVALVDAEVAEAVTPRL